MAQRAGRLQGMRKRQQARLVCGPCHAAMGSAIAAAFDVPQVLHCQKCGRSYPVTARRLIGEVAAALQSGRRWVRFPLLQVAEP